MTAGALIATARHFATAYMRNLQATRVISAIGILGLALGLAGAIAAALAARTALGFNGFVPDHERVYLGVSVLSGPGMAPDWQQASVDRAAALIAANVPSVEAVGRLAEAEVELRRGSRVATQRIYWADPAAFEVLRLPTLAGDVVPALRRPDGLVMTRREALRHFGRADALGQKLLVAGEPMVLRAVIADLPPGATDLEAGVFASGVAAHSALAPQRASASGAFAIGARTYLRLAPGVAPEEVERQMAPVIDGLVPPPLRGMYAMRLARVDRLALHEGFHPGARERLEIAGLVAALVLFVAVANFVNLGMALAARRKREIGVRRANGASRRHIAAQFLAESVASAMIAMLLAAAAVEVMLPYAAELLGVQVAFDYAVEPTLLLWLVAVAIGAGLLTGAYPAILLSTLPPATVLRDQTVALGGRGRIRQALVTAQFAVLIALLVATAVVYQQRAFAMREALRLDIDQVMTIPAPCRSAFSEEVGKLPGVRAVACAGDELLDGSVFAFVAAGGQRVPTDIVSMLPGSFALLGVEPVAGTLTVLPPEGEAEVTRIVVNDTAVRRFGYVSPEAAVGQVVPIPPFEPGPDVRARIVAVVPDFALTSVETAIEPTIFLSRPSAPGRRGLVLVKLAGREVPETLDEIDRIWRATGNAGPIERAFMSDHIERLYEGLERNARLVAGFGGLAAFLGCLGLVGLAMSAAERRTKEIGIRKALGARTDQVLALLLWQASRPVLWANLIAWPAAWWVMREWLNGFAYRVPLAAWLFPAAGALALAVAILSCGVQSYLVARRKPVDALRYE
jgi:putative ABC transport system permease protein